MNQHIQLENTKIQNIPLSLPFPEYYLTCFYCFCSLWKKNPSVPAVYNNNYYSFIPYKRTSLALHLIPCGRVIIFIPSRPCKGQVILPLSYPTVSALFQIFRSFHCHWPVLACFLLYFITGTNWLLLSTVACSSCSFC